MTKWYEIWGMEEDDPEPQMLAKIPATGLAPSVAAKMAKVFEEHGYVNVTVKETEDP